MQVNGFVFCTYLFVYLIYKFSKYEKLFFTIQVVQTLFELHCSRDKLWLDQWYVGYALKDTVGGICTAEDRSASRVTTDPQPSS